MDYPKSNPASDYAAKRLETNRDDRSDESKMWDDARLRGQIGTKAANDLIRTLDDLKSRR